MSKIVRHEFLGNQILFAILVLSGIGLPFAIIYLLNSTVRIEEEMENPSEFMEAFRAGKWSGKRRP